MKKLIAIILSVIIVSSAVISVFAFTPGTQVPVLTTPDKMPALYITGIAPLTRPKTGVVPKYNIDSDVFEYIEVVNLSGASLDIYEYYVFCVGSGVGTTADLALERNPLSVSPIKAGDFRHRTTTNLADGSPIPQNPASGIVNEREVFLIWFYTTAAYSVNVNLADFRAFWGIGNDVKVFIIDAGRYGAEGRVGSANEAIPAPYGDPTNEGRGVMQDSETSGIQSDNSRRILGLIKKCPTTGLVMGRTPGANENVIYNQATTYVFYGVNSLVGASPDTSSNPLYTKRLLPGMDPALDANKAYSFIYSQDKEELRMPSVAAASVVNATPGKLSAEQIASFGDALKAPETPVTTTPATTTATPSTTTKAVTSGGTTPPTSDGAVLVFIAASVAMIAAAVVFAKPHAKKK